VLLMDHLHWRTLQVKLSVTATRHEPVLALATLGDATQIGLFLFMLLCPRWPRQVLFHVTVAGNNDNIIV
jgi:hypothetical protein